MAEVLFLWSARVLIEGRSKPTAYLALPGLQPDKASLWPAALGRPWTQQWWLAAHCLVRNGPSRHKFMWFLLCLQKAVELSTAFSKAEPLLIIVK